MIHVSHHGHDRRTRCQIFFPVLFFMNRLDHLSTYIFGLKTEFFRNDIDRLGIETLIDRHHHTDTHTGSDNLVHLNIHHRSQIVCRNKLRQLQHFTFSFLHFGEFTFAIRESLAFFLTPFSRFLLSFCIIGEASQCLFYLLLYIFLAHLGLYRTLFLFIRSISSVIFAISSTGGLSTHR